MCIRDRDRVLKEREDFNRVAGKVIRITTSEPIKGSTLTVGRLINVQDDLIRLELSDGTAADVNYEKILKATLDIEFKK